MKVNLSPVNVPVRTVSSAPVANNSGSFMSGLFGLVVICLILYGLWYLFIRKPEKEQLSEKSGPFEKAVLNVLDKERQANNKRKILKTESDRRFSEMTNIGFSADALGKGDDIAERFTGLRTDSTSKYRKNERRARIKFNP
jgi:hypothetical protein